MVPPVLLLFKQFQLLFVGHLVSEATPLRGAGACGLTVVIVVKPVIKTLHCILEINEVVRRAGYHEKKCTAVYHGFQSSTVVCIAVYRKLYIETIWAFWCSTLNVWGFGNSIIFLPLPKSALKR